MTDINPMQDFLFTSLLHGIDLADKEYEADIYVGIFNILEYFVPDKNENRYLDFEIKGKNGHYKVIGNNSISALWLSAIFPPNPKRILETNEYISENIKYKYNPKTKKLTYRLIKK